MKQEVTICRVCYDRISNFLCVDCLKESVVAWLNYTNSSYLIDEFLELDKKFVKIFRLKESFESENEKTYCVKCKKYNSAPICVYCYLKEVYWWLFEKDFMLAKKFSKMLNLDFLNLGYFPFNKPMKLELAEIVFEREKVDINVCERCEQESEYIKPFNGQWICENCREEE